MKKRIGLLGGISYESTIKYYELLMQRYFKKKQDYYYPEIVIYSLDFQKFTDLENSGNTQEYINYIVSGVDALKKAGVDFVAMAANSPHAVFPQVQAKAQVPMISIVKVIAEEAKKRAIQKALLLGIKFTMQSRFYHDVFKKNGIEIVTPKEKEQDEINRIIFQELVIGIKKPESKKTFLTIIEAYDADAVILGCTEIPLLISEHDTRKIVLDPLSLHVDAILAKSISPTS